MSTARRVGASVLPLLMLLAPRLASAQHVAPFGIVPASTPEGRAQVLSYSRGETELLANHFDAAERAFGASLALGFRPSLLALAMVHRAQGHYASAIGDLEAYVRSADATPSQRVALVAAIDAMRPLEAHVLLRAAADARVQVQLDGRAAPLGAMLVVDPNATHQVHAEAAGFRVLRESLRLRPGEYRVLDLRLAHEAPPVYARWWFWTATGAGVVTVAAIVTLLATAHHDPPADCGALSVCINPM